MNAVQCIVSFIGSMFVDKIGRRPLLIWVNVGCSICWIGVTVASSVIAPEVAQRKAIEDAGGVWDTSLGNKAASGATVAMIYIFQAVYSFGWTPLQALYPVEVLSFEMRAKGMAFSNLFVTCGTLVNQFGFPVALDNIQWKTYIVFMVWCLIQAAIIWYFIPETKNRTVSLPEFAHFGMILTICYSLRNLMRSLALRTQERLQPPRRRSISMSTTMLSVLKMSTRELLKCVDSHFDHRSPKLRRSMLWKGKTLRS